MISLGYLYMWTSPGYTPLSAWGMISMFSAKVHAARSVSLLLMILTAAFLVHGCSDEITPPVDNIPSSITGALVHATECKENLYGIDAGSMVTLDCVTWDWDGSDTLRVTHVNAGLNCCPGTIVGLVDIDGSDITIEETEGDDAMMCHCLCLYDLYYEISGISGGVITITINEQYIADDAEPLVATIDLNAEAQGSLCLFRGTYPWGSEQPGEDPVGTIDDYSGCKDLTGTADFPGPFSADSACVIVYTMPAENAIRIFHVNTAYNCCVEALDGDFEFGEGQITITGREYPPGGLCDCICLYDVTYTVSNLEPGIYTISFVEPYLPPDQEQLTITVDLTQEGCWTSCVPREGYPWDEGLDEASDLGKLKALYDKIVEYIGTPYCDGGECRYIGVGSKPCGGPWGYLIYSTGTVNEDHLRILVDVHAAFENYMNFKYGYNSDCSVPNPPVLECRDGICREARK